MARNYEIPYRWRSVMIRSAILVDATGSNLPTRVANDAKIILALNSEDETRCVDIRTIEDIFVASVPPRSLSFFFSSRHTC